VAIFVSDTFTDTDATKLENHAPEVGGVWLRRSGRGPGVKVTSNTVSAGNSKLYRYTNAAVPGASEYTVDADFTLIGASSEVWGLIGRFVDSNNFYAAYYSDADDTYYLEKTVLGVSEVLASSSGAYTGSLELQDGSQKLYLDSVEELSATDTALTSAGFAGIVMSATSSDATCDNFVANDTGEAVSDNASMQPVHHWWPR
jgi:hypothetical protein